MESEAEPDVAAMIMALEDHRVRYVVIGGMAAILQGVPLERTLDVDITPARTQANLGRLAEALRSIDAKLRNPGLDEGFEIPLDERTFRNVITVTFITRHGPLDVSLLPDGTDGYDDLRSGAVMLNRFGTTVPVACVEDIARSKEAAGREKDILHLVVIRRFLDDRAR